jgi:hypothetical protein
MTNDKKTEKFKQLLWFTGGALCGLAMLSISKASVAPSNITDDTAIYQNLSEIKVAKDQVPSFDGDISRLSKMENHYQEKLPSSLANRPSLNAPMKRIAQKPYHYQGQDRQSGNSAAMN